MVINPSIFKAYDIRGIAPEDFLGDVPERIASAVLQVTGARKVVLGCDARVSSPDLVARTLAALIASGVEVVDIGLCTTPMFNFAVASDSSVGAGIMITASHNPAKYNGFKMVSADARPISGKKIGEVIASGVVPTVISSAARNLEKRDVLPEYLEAILRIAKWEGASPRIVIDAGNGMVGVPLPAFLKRTGIDAQVLFGEVDCSFPNHEANPVHEATLADVKRAVVESGAAFGVAFDGDADRIGFVDEKGQRIAGDHIGALIAEELMELDALVLGDTNAGWAFREAVERAGGKFELTPVGHANIKEKMRASKALFAAELSYHFYYRDFYNVESTLLTLLLVLRRYVRLGGKMSELVAPYRKYSASGEINFEVHDAVAVIGKVRATFEKDAKQVFDFDGLRMEFADWWFSLRASNTEPLVRLNVEAKTPEILDARKEQLSILIQ